MKIDRIWTYSAYAILTLGWLATVVMYALVYPQKEIQIITIERPTIIKQCDYACTPCADSPPIDKCEFTFAYQAIKDSLEFRRGDVFYYSDISARDYIHFCTAEKSDDNLCLSVDAILNNGFFKPINPK